MTSKAESDAKCGMPGRLQQRQKLRERREQRAKAAEDDRRNGLTEAERVVREAKAAKNMEALLQELDQDAARAAAKQDTRRARRKGRSQNKSAQIPK